MRRTSTLMIALLLAIPIGIADAVAEPAGTSDDPNTQTPPDDVEPTCEAKTAACNTDLMQESDELLQDDLYIDHFEEPEATIEPELAVPAHSCTLPSLDCILDPNDPPGTPSTPSGPSSGSTGVSYTYSTYAYDPEGDVIDYQFAWGDGSYSYRYGYSSGYTASASHSWSSGGTYCVQTRATDSHGATGAWSNCRYVTITQGDAYEPDDSFSQYTSITVASGLNSQSRSLDPAGDEDYIRFYGYSGRTYIFYTTGSTDTYGHLYNSGQTQLASNDDGGSGYNFHISYDVTSSGYHYLRIRGYSGSTTGDYTLYYEYDTTPVSNNPPNTPGTPTGSSSVDTGVSSTYCTSATDPDGDTVRYRFVWGDGSASTVTSYVSSGNSACASHSWSSAGSYCVQARAEDSGGLTSSYSGCKSVTASMPTGDSYEPDDSFSQYTSITVASGLNSQSRSLDPAGDEDYIRFYGDSGRTYIFYTTGSTDTYGHLYNSGQTQLASNDDGGSGYNFHISYDVTSSGYHYLRVRGFSGSTTGAYTLYYEYDTTPVSNNPPNACFSTSVSGMKATVDTGCSTDADGDPMTYTIDWGDGTTSSGSVTTADDTRTHEYDARGWGTASTSNIGAYAIQVVVSDGSTTDSATTTRDIGPSDADLALYWAPVLYQDTALAAKPSSIYYDEIVRFDFDGDWTGLNNWVNAGGGDHDAYVYYHVSETETDYYIGYAVFHARDFDSVWGGCCDEGEHENDMETVLIMVHKDGTEYGEFVATLTMAHNYINAYKQHFNDGSASYNLQYRAAAGGGDAFSGDIDFESDSYGKHVKLDIEHGGHGIYHHPKIVNEANNPDLPIWDDSTNDFRGGDGNIYKPRTWAETPGEGTGGSQGDDSYVPYKLVPINTMWGKRYDYGSTQPFDHYGAFNGAHGELDAAHAPWAIYNKANGEDREDTLWFEHPAIVFMDYFQNFPESPSIAYTYRSVPMAWESHHNYGESSVLMEWTRPGMSEGRVVMGDVTVVPGDTIEYWSGFNWVLLSSDSTSAWVTGDTVRLRTTSDWDGDTDYGFKVLRVEWR